MRVLHERCCGLDIHQRFVVACLLATSPDGAVHKEVRTSNTMTADVLARSDWLRAAGCGPVVMESTGSYWRPVVNLLEEQCAVRVVNAYHVKAAPGRTTDVKDAEWLAALLRHGLVRASFIPSPTQRHRRDLTRYRLHLVDERARLTNRLQAVLEDANSKLASKLAAVVTDVRGLWSARDLAAPARGRNRRAGASRADRVGSCVPSGTRSPKRSLVGWRPTTCSRHARAARSSGLPGCGHRARGRRAGSALGR
jgi:transposase